MGNQLQLRNDTPRPVSIVSDTSESELLGASKAMSKSEAQLPSSQWPSDATGNGAFRQQQTTSSNPASRRASVQDGTARTVGDSRRSSTSANGIVLDGLNSISNSTTDCTEI